jgi:DNA-binding GntR family transcriptional regulator
LKEIDARLFAFRLIDFAKPERVIASCRKHLKVLDLLGTGDVRGCRNALVADIEGNRATARSALTEALTKTYENL